MILIFYYFSHLLSLSLSRNVLIIFYLGKEKTSEIVQFRESIRFCLSCVDILRSCSRASLYSSSIIHPFFSIRIFSPFVARCREVNRFTLSSLGKGIDLTRLHTEYTVTYLPRCNAQCDRVDTFSTLAAFFTPARLRSRIDLP